LLPQNQNKPRNFLWSADVNINASLHLVNLFKSTGAKAPVIPFRNKNNNSGYILHLSLPLSHSLSPSLPFSLSLSLSLTGEEGVRTLASIKHARNLSIPHSFIHSVSMYDYFINNFATNVNFITSKYL
jgi:hypothetical protein